MKASSTSLIKIFANNKLRLHAAARLRRVVFYSRFSRLELHSHRVITSSRIAAE